MPTGPAPSAPASPGPASPAIEHAGGTVHWLDTPGLRIRAAHWPHGDRGTIVLLHGRTEFIEKYLEPIAELQRRGFAVWTFDWRGQGRSRPRGAAGLARRPVPQHIDDFGQYNGDLDRVLDRLVIPTLRRRPLVMLAHSMGGHIGAHALSRRPEVWSRAILLAPMLGLLRRGRRPPFFAAALVRLACAFPGGARRFGPGAARVFDPARPFEANRLTQCPARYASDMALVRDNPDLAVGGVSWGWIGAALRSGRQLHDPRTTARMVMPVLVVAAGADTVVDNRPLRRFALRLPRGRFVEVTGARHELLREHDPHRNAAWAAIDEVLAPD